MAEKSKKPIRGKSPEMKKKQDYAKLLFLKEHLSQKEIAVKVGVTEKTIGKWVNQQEWQVLKSSETITIHEQIKRTLNQIHQINIAISEREDGKKFPSNQEADILSKLSAIVKNLKTEINLNEIIEVFELFSEWLRHIDLDRAKDNVELQDKFIEYFISKNEK